MIKINNLKVAYGSVQVIHGVSLEVKKGTVVALIGSNGAGKTTVLKTISGILKPTEGEIIFDGNRIDQMKPFNLPKLGLAHSLEGRQIFPGMSIEDNLLMGAYTLTDKDKINKLMKEVYELFPRLEERKKQLGGTLSGGEAQMLAMSRALMLDPKLILLDEPSLGLAPVVVSQIFDIVKELKKVGKTILLVEQNVPLALGVADYGYVMQTGKIVISGDAKTLLNSNDVQRAYLGI